MSKRFEKKISFYKKHLLRLIDKHIKENQTRKPYKYNNKHKLEIIIYVLKTGCCWNHLKEVGDESTYRKFFYKLVEMNIFKTAFYNLLGKLIKLKLVKFDNIFIDSTSIINRVGLKEFVNFGFLPKKHKSLKIHSFIDKNQVPLGFEISKGSEHDVNFVEPLVKSLENKITLENIKIIGDKGYVSSKLKNKLKKDSKIKFIYKNRKNQIKNTVLEEILLKERIKVEHSYATLKQFRRIDKVNERKMKNYSSFVYLSFLLIIFTKFF